MPGMRSDRARARARELLASLYPVPDDAEFHRLREFAVDYIQEAERLEAERKGRGEQLCWGTRCSIFQIRECAELVVAEAGSSDP